MKFSLCAALVGIALFSSAAWAQDYSIAAGNVSGSSGSTVTVDVTLDNIQPIRGFSFGLQHDASVALLTSINEGSASTALNLGMGADFEHIDLTPVGGPGAIYGVVVSTSAPIEDIPAGVGQQIAQLDYTLVGAPGVSTALDFTGLMGNPPVATVVSVAGVSFAPAQTSGQIQVEIPPVTNVMATTPDPCTCETTVSWDAPMGVSYTSFTVTIDGGAATVVTASPAVITVPAGASNVCVVGTVAAGDSPETCIPVTCNPAPLGMPPTGINCSVDVMTCVATITWTNAEPYTALSLTVDGTAQALVATDEMAMVTLNPDGVAVEFCVIATDGCGNVLAAVCCNGTCPSGQTNFVRGDCNVDAAFNIADAVFTLNFLFSMGMTPDCLDACDCNDDGTVNIADAVCKLGALFGAMTVPPAAPHPACGVDPTDADGLTCDSFAPCP